MASKSLLVGVLLLVPGFVLSHDKKLPRELPELGLKTLQGKVVEKKDLVKGRVYLIEFWATWCTTCKKIAPMLQDVYKQYKGESFEMYSVSIDTDLAALQKQLREKPFANPVLLDPTNETFKRWKLTQVPATFLVKDGKIVHEWIGDIKKEDLEPKIRALVGS